MSFCVNRKKYKNTTSKLRMWICYKRKKRKIHSDESLLDLLDCAKYNVSAIRYKRLRQLYSQKELDCLHSKGIRLDNSHLDQLLDRLLDAEYNQVFDTGVFDDIQAIRTRSRSRSKSGESGHSLTESLLSESVRLSDSARLADTNDQDESETFGFLDDLDEEDGIFVSNNRRSMVYRSGSFCE